MDTSDELIQELQACCSSLLPKLHALLSKSIHSQEHEFLRLGEKLQEFAFGAGELGNLTQSLLENFSRQGMEGVIQGFTSELQEMHDVCGTESSSKALGDLQNIVKTISGLDELLREFSRLVRHLQMLGISTRIESARLGADGSGFSTLADDVEKLAHRIEDHSSKIGQDARSLADLSNLALRQTESMRDKQSQCSTSIFSDIRHNVAALSDIVGQSEGLTQSLALRSATIQGSIGEVVSSLQFHDIVRQQVEHVEEALDDINKMLGENKPQQEKSDIANWVADVASIQRWQVKNGSERFFNAVETLITNLGNVRDTLQEMQQEVTSLLGSDAKGSSTTLVRIEKSVDGMLGTMQVFASQGEKIGKTMGSVATTVSEISSYLGDIEEVGAEIELIALNASIKAAHTGDQGAAMGVLATSVQHLSKEASRQTNEVADVLRRISDAAALLGERAADFLDTSQVLSMMERLKLLMQHFKDMDATISNGFLTLIKKNSNLTKEITQLIDSIQLHHAVSALLGKAEKELEVLENKSRRLAPEGTDTQRSERLKKLLERYTMDAERLVHQHVFSDDAHTASQQNTDDGRWDNVELF